MICRQPKGRYRRPSGGGKNLDLDPYFCQVVSSQNQPRTTQKRCKGGHPEIDAKGQSRPIAASNMLRVADHGTPNSGFTVLDAISQIRFSRLSRNDLYVSTSKASRVGFMETSGSNKCFEISTPDAFKRAK
jgi:hypothetical protein